MAYTKVCSVCSGSFVSTQPNKKTCSNKCHRKRIRSMYGFSGSNLPTNFLGRLNEYLVMIDIAKKGYDVYISAFPQQHYDLIVMDRVTNKTLKVEVKTGYRSKNGQIYLPKHPHDKWDIMAVYIVANNEVVYLNNNGKKIEL